LPWPLVHMNHPYREFEASVLWREIDAELVSLERNGDVELHTPREYVVGALCQRLNRYADSTYQSLIKNRLDSAFERLFASDEVFDQVVRTLGRHRARALPVLADLLNHPDPGWRLKAATALGRMHEAPVHTLPGLLRLFRSNDAAAKVAALSAMEWLPAPARQRVIPSVIRLLASRPPARPRFAIGRANVPRAVAAHFLAQHGGARGRDALRQAARRRRDPVIHHIEAALEAAHSGEEPPNKRLHPTAAVGRRGR